MGKELVMGNQAIALAALDAGVECVFGYPGTPSTEIVETIYRNKKSKVYVEWSVNEKVALEIAAGASYSGSRCMVVMKQVGLNACTDPAMNLSYIGVNGGLVLVVADDPGPISSQTEQDTRMFAFYAKLPLFDPSSTEEAYDMVQDAFEYSEKYNTLVLLRPTTRVCHSYAGIHRRFRLDSRVKKGFYRNDKWFCFPHLSYLNHIKIETRYQDLRRAFDKYKCNACIGKGKVLIIACGINFAYAQEAIKFLGLHIEEYMLLKISTIPLPEKILSEALKKVGEVVVIEELEAVVERYLYYLCSFKNIKMPKVYGKLSGDVKIAGENYVYEIIGLLEKVFCRESKVESYQGDNIKERKMSLCAGCPHRASFYVVKFALKSRDTVFCGDIGCYTLGKMEPLNMLDTCLCMGAGITMGLGIQLKNPEKIVVSFIGDSTFFHTGIQGVVNAIYNNNNITIIILDNLSTAMTGGQPTPETGAVEGTQDNRISIEQVILGLGITKFATVSPYDFDKAVQSVLQMVELDGVKVIIFRAPCKKTKSKEREASIDNEICTNCGECIYEIGCPALSFQNGTIQIKEEECNGCGLCATICGKHAIKIQSRRRL
jgi:indolepyruvate ferredoxin oxidoreductase, alpha subunit